MIVSAICFASSSSFANELEANNLDIYLSKNSLSQGEQIEIYYNNPNPVNIKIIKIDANYYENPNTVFEAKNLPARTQPGCPIENQSFMVECSWLDPKVISTSNFSPGLYLVNTSSSSSNSFNYFVIRTPNPAGTSLYKTSFMTLAAYNSWGGYSLYHGDDGQLNSRASKVSLDRPLDQEAQNFIFEYEIPIAVAVSKNLKNVSWASDLDVHRGITNLKKVKQIVTSGHDEYWTPSERNAVESAVAKGTNLFVTGANTMYWRVRTENSPNGLDRRIISYKNTDLDPIKNQVDSTAMWRQQPKMRPESMLLGNLYNDWYWHCNADTTDWVIADINWWGYKGTGANSNSRYFGLVGREVDEVPVGHYSIPRSTQIVAHTSKICNDESGNYTLNHDATFTSKLLAGSTFAVGSQTWTCALNPDCNSPSIPTSSKNFAVKVTSNVLIQFNKGRLSGSFKPKNNIQKYYKGKKIKYNK